VCLVTFCYAAVEFEVQTYDNNGNLKQFKPAFAG
jgi:hypothetical protein